MRLAETLKKDSPFAPNSDTNEPPLRPYQLWKKARYKEAFRKSDQMHKTFEKSSLAMTHKLDDIIKLPKSLPKKTIKEDLECDVDKMKDAVGDPSDKVILDKESPKVLWIFTWTILDDDLAGLSCFFFDIEQNQGSISFSRFSYFSFIRFQAEGVTSPTTVHYVALILNTNSEPFEAPPSPDYASAFDDDIKLLDAPTTPPPTMLSPHKRKLEARRWTFVIPRIRAWRDQEGLPSLFELGESSSATHVLFVIGIAQEKITESHIHMEDAKDRL
nr:hypothetical protein [Tanacetum cinerariifolium]